MGKIRVGQRVHTQVIGTATSSSSGTYAIHARVGLPRGVPQSGDRGAQQ
jgi:hypothetical protein